MVYQQTPCQTQSHSHHPFFFSWTRKDANNTDANPHNIHRLHQRFHKYGIQSASLCAKLIGFTAREIRSITV